MGLWDAIASKNIRWRFFNGGKTIDTNCGPKTLTIPLSGGQVYAIIIIVGKGKKDTFSNSY